MVVFLAFRQINLFLEPIFFAAPFLLRSGFRSYDPMWELDITVGSKAEQLIFLTFVS